MGSGIAGSDWAKGPGLAEWRDKGVATTTEEIKRSLIHKILIGQYPVGGTLPSCRELAAELGINRNTASKIYQELGREGLVKIVRGRGVVVVRQRAAGNAPAPSVREHLLAAAREAKLLGMEREAFMQQAVEVVDSLYQRQRPAVAFVECNEQDAVSLSRELEADLGVPVQPVLLTALERSPSAVIAEYDIVTTTLYHLMAVTRAMAGAVDRVVAVHAPPDPDALLEIARLEPHARIGIICAQATTQQYLASAVGMVHHGDVRTYLLGDKESLRSLEGQTDILVDVPSCHKEVKRLFPRLPILTVGFHIDPKSLAPLRDRLARTLNEDIPAVTSPQ